MGQYARVFIKPGDGELQQHTDGPLELKQGYDGFAVLSGVRNYCSIVPLFSPRDFPPYIEQLKEVTEEDKVCSESRYEEYFHTYRPHIWFTVEELNALDLDRPLVFLEPREELHDMDQHRLNSVKEHDTYRTFIERETTLTNWFDAIRNANPEFVVVAFD
jgi:hypothetical protein